VSVPNQEQIEAMVKASHEQEPRKADGKPRFVQSCDFRTAGRLSNENARALTAIHETFARHLASALDAFLGTGVEVKLQRLDQLAIKDHAAAISSLSYIAPFSFSTTPSTTPTTMIVECDVDMVFPIIEVLMGGTGKSASDARELSEIEEEIMQDVTSLVARQAEIAWHIPNSSLTANRRVKSSVVHQYGAPNERVTLARFEVEIAGTTGSFRLVFPTAFLNLLIKQIKQDQPQKKGLRYFPAPDLRERILDCDFQIAAELPAVKVPVRDLVALQPGCVLKLRAPVRTSGMLTVEGVELFEAAPVRTGSQKAAQLGRRLQSTSWGGK
jgi:flagellar motor switch protein FliM